MKIQEEHLPNVEPNINKYTCQNCLKSRKNICLDSDFKANLTCSECIEKASIFLNNQYTAKSMFTHDTIKSANYYYLIDINEIDNFDICYEDKYKYYSGENEHDLILEISPKINKLYQELRAKHQKQIKICTTRKKVLQRMIQRNLVYKQLQNNAKKSKNRIIEEGPVVRSLSNGKIKKHNKLLNQLKKVLLEYKVPIQCIQSLLKLKGSHLNRNILQEIMTFINLEARLIARRKSTAKYSKQDVFLSVIPQREARFSVRRQIREKIQKNSFKSMIEWWRFSRIETTCRIMHKCTIPNHNILIAITNHELSDYWKTIAFYNYTNEYDKMYLTSQIDIIRDDLGDSKVVKSAEYLDKVIFFKFDPQQEILSLVEESRSRRQKSLKIYKIEVVEENQVKRVKFKNLAKLENLRNFSANFDIRVDNEQIEIFFNGESGFNYFTNAFDDDILTESYSLYSMDFLNDKIETLDIRETKKEKEPKKPVIEAFMKLDQYRYDSFWGWPTKRVKLGNGKWKEGTETFLKDTELIFKNDLCDNVKSYNYFTNKDDITRDRVLDRQILEIPEKKEIWNFKYNNFKMTNFLPGYFFQFCIPIDNNLVLLYDYKNKIHIYNYTLGQIEETHKMQKLNDDYKFMELKHTLHIRESQMIIFMSTKGRLLPFIYSKPNRGFKKLLNLEDIDLENYKCPISEIAKEDQLETVNTYAKCSQGSRSNQDNFNSYYIKKNYAEIESRLYKIQHQKANRILFDEFEKKVIVLKTNCIFICGLSSDNELVLNKMHVFDNFKDRYVDWESVELFGKFGNRKIIFNNIEEKSRNTFYRLESIL